MAISIGDALLKLGVDKGDFDKQMTGIGAAIKKHQKAIGVGMVALGGAILATGALSIKTFAQMGDEVQKMALRTGFSTEALSELRHAAEISGSTLTSLEKGVKKMSKTIVDAGDGLETYVRSFRKIGLTAEELMDLSPEEQFNKITMAIAELENPTLRAAVAQEIFGRAGTELLPLMAEGADGIATLRQEAHDLGIVFDQEAADSAANFNDAMTRMNEAMSGVKMVIAETLIPVLMPLIDWIKEAISNMSAWIKEHPGLSKVIIIAAGALGVLLTVLGGLLLLMPGITSAIALFGTTLHLSLGPIGWVFLGIMALVAAGIALWKNWDKVAHFGKIAWSTLKIIVLTAIERMLAGLAKLTSWIPILGEKVDEAHKKISNMIDAEEIRKDAYRAQRSLEIAGDVIEDTGDKAEETTESLEDLAKSLEIDLPEASEATIKALEEQAKTVEELKKSYEELGETATNGAGAGGGVGGGGGEEPGITGPFPVPEEEALPYTKWLKPGTMWTKVANFGGATVYAAFLSAIRKVLGGATAYRTIGQLFAPYIKPEYLDELFKLYSFVPRGQEGGIAMRPMLARIGEQAPRIPEALIPFDKLERLFGGAGGRLVNIFVELDGRVIAKVIGEPLVEEIRLKTGVRI